MTPVAEPARVAPHPPSALAKAVSRWLTRLPEKPTLVPAFRAVSLREMITRITSALSHDRPVSFDRIRGTCMGRQETAVAFLALLTLMRRHVIVVTQTELFGSITLSRANADHNRDRHLLILESDNTHGDKLSHS